MLQQSEKKKFKRVYSTSSIQVLYTFLSFFFSLCYIRSILHIEHSYGFMNLCILFYPI